MQSRRITAALLAALSGCMLLCGCGSDGAGLNSTAEGLWLGIEPAKEDEFGKAVYEDGLYLSQEVKEPVPDPYEKDTKQKSEGKTDDGLRYALYQEHAEIIGHVPKFDAESIIIPETIEGLPVTRIASVAVTDDNKFEADKTGGLYGCYTLASVTLPETITSIGDYAFYGCKNLKEINIPERVMHIGARAFAMCSSLNALTVPSGIDTIGEGAFALTPWYDDLQYHRDLIIFNGRLYDTGRRCTGEVIVPNYVISVGERAFYGCEGVRSVILPECVESIGAFAFCGCPDLRSVVIMNPDCKIVNAETTVSNKISGGDKDFYRGKIFGIKNSTAEQFAKKQGFTFEEASEYYERQKNERKKQKESEQAEKTEESVSAEDAAV